MVLTFCQLCLTGKNIRNPKKRYLTKNLSADHMIIMIVRIPPMISDNCDLLDLSDDQMILMNDQVSKPKTIRPSPPGPSSGQPRLQEGSMEADRWTSPGPLHIHQGEQRHVRHQHRGVQPHHPYHLGIQRDCRPEGWLRRRKFARFNVAADH